MSDDTATVTIHRQRGGDLEAITVNLLHVPDRGWETIIALDEEGEWVLLTDAEAQLAQDMALDGLDETGR